jgi:HSP20 family protein
MDTDRPSTNQNPEQRPSTEASSQPQPVPVKIYRTAERVAVAAPMAGSEPDDITVEVTDDGRLRLHAALRGLLKGDKQVLADEWNPGPYDREVSLPAPVNGEMANVTYGNGVLVVVLPVTEGPVHPARLTLTTTGHGHGERAGNAGHPVESYTAEEHHALRSSGANWRAMLGLFGD